MTRIAEMSAIMAAISCLLSSKTALTASLLVSAGQAHRYHTQYLGRDLCSSMHTGMIVIDARMFSSKHVMIRKRDFERLC